jgi:hypothetical protein
MEGRCKEEKQQLSFKKAKTIFWLSHPMLSKMMMTEEIAFNMATELECSFLINNRIKRKITTVA